MSFVAENDLKGTMNQVTDNKRAHPFDHLPHTTRNHFVLHLFTAVYYLVHYLQRAAEPENGVLETLFDRYPFLGGYFGELVTFLPPTITWGEGLSWWQTEIGRWEAASPIHLPLSILHEAGVAGFNGRIALLLAGLVEEDSRFGSLFADQQDGSQRRPTLELIGRIALNPTQAGLGLSDPWHICRPLLAASLLQAASQEGPRAEWALHVPAPLWDLIRGESVSQPFPGCRYQAAASLPRIDDLILPLDFCRQLQQVPLLLTNGKVHTIILRGTPGSERLPVMGAVARQLGRGVLLVEASGKDEKRPLATLGTFCTLSRTLPVLQYDLGPGESVTEWPLANYDGPAGMVLGMEGGLREGILEDTITLTLPPTAAGQRRRQWQATLAGHPVEDLAEISRRFHLAGGYIRQVAATAIGYAALDEAPIITVEHVRAASRTLNRQLLDSLATHLPEEVSWQRLVVSEPTVDRLNQLEQRCRHREQLLDHLGVGFGTTTGRGVRALFTGGSGTGKTLAARILAGQLGMDLYRVDLAAVVNKYIGETEKNLSRLLSRAEELDVVLLLDEGDALLGGRTEVRSANDRYANLETDYLLQRLEHYEGIILITTNVADNIDFAFQRRMDVVVNFVPPQAEERWHIWQLHLPPQHQVDAAYLEEVAVRCALTGGQIRNAALQATLLALQNGRSTVTADSLAQALQAEYRKAGVLFPLRQESNGHSQTAVENFMDAFADEAWPLGQSNE